MSGVAASPVPTLFQIVLLVAHTIASPVWMPQFLSGGSGRNIRHLPCVSRRTGEQGTCMFAYNCMKSNGTHLGTCIDRFYFGSCCKLSENQDPLLDNDITYPLVSNKVTENDPLLQPSVSTIVDAIKFGTSVSVGSTSTSQAPINNSPTKTTTEKFYVPISTSATKPNKTEIFGETIKKPVTVTTNKVSATTQTPPTTTQQYLLSTFQVVHHNSKPTTQNTPTTTSSTPSSTTTKTTTTKKPIKSTTRKPPTKKTTAKPSTNPVKASTQKPAETKPSSTSTIYKPVSTITSKPTAKPTKKPTAPTKPTIVATTTASPSTFGALSTTSEVIFTKPGSELTITNSSDFSTFRPDLSPTTTSPLITAPGLTTFTYISDRVTTATSVISNEITTENPPASVNQILEEQSNVIFQQAGTPAASSTSTENSSESITKAPWVEIPHPTENSNSSTTTSSSAKPTATTESFITNTESNDASTTPVHSPSFGNLNVSDYTQVCGRRLYPESRVVGGEKATFGKWPWQISLRQWRTSTYLHKCGAALLNENWAITAAHCVENVPPSDLLLRLGEHDLSREDEPYGYQERRVQIVASHPQFDPRTFEYDLALLRFYEPVKFQPNIIPICVPEDSTNFVGQDAHVTGWGRLYEDGPLPSVLQEVSVPVINNTICENMYRSAGYIEHIPDIFICAGWKKGGFDSCEGDSGGPMVIERADKRWLLAGVISWGIGCAEPNQPGVYTRISQFRDWINQILQF